MKIPVNCKTCGMEFLKQECHIKRSPTNFCSKNCYDVEQGSNKLEKICEICGLEFLIRPCENKKFVTCESKECRTAKKSGNKNPNWRGGTSNERVLWNSTKEAKTWRKSVLFRDNFTCKNCHKRGGDLEAHHKKPWAIFPKLRCALSNGQTLCLKCHKKTFKGIRFWRMIAELEKAHDESRRKGST